MLEQRIKRIPSLVDSPPKLGGLTLHSLDWRVGEYLMTCFCLFLWGVWSVPILNHRFMGWRLETMEDSGDGWNYAEFWWSAFLDGSMEEFCNESSHGYIWVNDCGFKAKQGQSTVATVWYWVAISGLLWPPNIFDRDLKQWFPRVDSQ